VRVPKPKDQGVVWGEAASPAMSTSARESGECCLQAPYWGLGQKSPAMKSFDAF